MEKPKFSVLDMAEAYSQEHDMNPDDLFKKPEKEVEEVVNETKEEVPPPPKKKAWAPDSSLLEGMAEMTAGPVIYAKDEIKYDDPDKSLRDITDDEAIKNSVQSMDEMERQLYHIELVKKKFGIKLLQIPDGPISTKIRNAASDPDTKSAQAALEILFKEIIDLYPLFIKEWSDPSKNPNSIQNKKKINQPEIVDIPKDIPVEEDDTPEKPIIEEVIPTPKDDTPPVQIIINKMDANNISFTKEEVEKVRKARTFELNIVEHADIPYSQIEDADENAVDTVLAQYVRKANDVVAALPASKYRATFTGLSYTEIIDLSYSQELNTTDAEKKKWSIAFQHVKNPSIGPFADFEDFMKKTSYIDLEFILWKVLCATSMDKELITVDCHGKLENGSPCNRSYEWIYAPNALLDTSNINPAVLEEMKKTAEASSMEDIQKNYKEAMLNTDNVIELPTSKFKVLFGHISAYDYVNEVFPELSKIREEENPVTSPAITYSALAVIKAFLVPKDDGKLLRIKGSENLVRVLNSLNEIDWQTIGEIMKIMTEPYRLRFVLKDIVCPQCHTKSDIEIDGMDRLLFLAARSLSLTTVILKRN